MLYGELEFMPADVRLSFRKSDKQYTVQDLLKIINWTSYQMKHDVKSKHNSKYRQSSQPIHLLTQWYHEDNIHRRQELVSVLHINLINQAISKIYFLQPKNKKTTIWEDVQIDTQFPFDALRKKGIVHYLNESKTDRLTISEALLYSNHLVKNGYAVIINLDIFFDPSLFLLSKMHVVDKKTAYYLSRYEVDPYISIFGSQCSDEFLKS